MSVLILCLFITKEIQREQRLQSCPCSPFWAMNNDGWRSGAGTAVVHDEEEPKIEALPLLRAFSSLPASCSVAAAMACLYGEGRGQGSWPPPAFTVCAREQRRGSMHTVIFGCSLESSWMSYGSAYNTNTVTNTKKHHVKH
jgi:hypothetical protein